MLCRRKLYYTETTVDAGRAGCGAIAQFFARGLRAAGKTFFGMFHARCDERQPPVALKRCRCLWQASASTGLLSDSILTQLFGCKMS